MTRASAPPLLSRPTTNPEEAPAKRRGLLASPAKRRGLLASPANRLSVALPPQAGIASKLAALHSVESAIDVWTELAAEGPEQSRIREPEPVEL